MAQGRYRLVSILISVDSGLTLDTPHNFHHPTSMFQSLFQWIPVLHRVLFLFYPAWLLCFNPYFSGFRSYTADREHKTATTYMFQSLFQWIPVLHWYNKHWRWDGYAVSILISVDSGLTLACQSLLYQLNPVSILISVDSGLTQYFLSQEAAAKLCFNPYFSGFRSYTAQWRYNRR